jgi:uncharacterized protein YggT (Ycf19 family)
MSLIDFILNLAALLLWLNWRAASLPVRREPALSLLSTLRTVGPARPTFYHWIGLPVLLVARAIFYWQAGPPVHWNPHLPLGPTMLSFRSDVLGRMLLFSLLSFAAALWVCYLWLLALSCVNTKNVEADPIRRLIRAWLGSLDRWPRPLKLLLPPLLATAGWWLASLWLARLSLLPGNSAGRVLAQGAVIGLDGCLTVEYPLLALLALYLLNSYVYLGEWSLWSFVNTTSRRLLDLWRWLPLRVGRIDLTPLVCMGLIMAAAWAGHVGLARLYVRYLR